MEELRLEKGETLQIIDALYNRAQDEWPWAAPHHSASAAGLLGGGNPPRPGALTKAHGGILFLDELFEYAPSVLDSLREPMEKGFLEIFRAGNQVIFPSRFQLIAATNPCRCGYWGAYAKQCFCDARSRRIYQNRMSGPLFDRFDVKISCPSPMGNEPQVGAVKILQRLREAFEFKHNVGKLPLACDVQAFLDERQNGHLVNYRANKKVHSLAQTLALIDLAESVQIRHFQEAFELQDFKGLENPC